MGVPKRMRFEVFRRDGFRCRYCGATPDRAELRPDHVVPEALGGKTEPANLATACIDCNAGKGSVLLAGTIRDVHDLEEPDVPWFAGELLNIITGHLGDEVLVPIVRAGKAADIPDYRLGEWCARRLVTELAARAAPMGPVA